MGFCTKCLISKDDSQFSPSKLKNGRGLCRECHNKLPSQNKEGRKKYRETHKEHLSKKSKESYRKHLKSYMLGGAKYRAKNRNMEFNLTKEDLIIPEFCPVLGIKLEVADDGRAWHAPSIDRIDNNKGYTKDNIIIISDRANSLKADSTQEERIKLYNFYHKYFVKDNENENLHEM